MGWRELRVPTDFAVKITIFASLTVDNIPNDTDNWPVRPASRPYLNCGILQIIKIDNVY